MKVFISLFLFVFSNFVMAQQSFESENYKVIYHTQNGKFHGLYTSYYKNGNLKARGNFNSNNRTGIWEAWDSLGVKKIKRDYTSNSIYKRILPPVPNIGPIPLLSEFPYKLEYNDKGFINHFDKLQEANVVSVITTLQKIPKENNKEIYNNNKLFNLLVSLVKDSTIIAYDTIDFDFTMEYNISNLDTLPMEIDHFLIKSESIFDNQRFLTEDFIVGICPVIKTKNGPKKVFCIFFPYVREHLASIPISFEENPKVKTLDDVFFFNVYSSILISQGRVYDKKIPPKVFETQFPNKINFNLLELEHEQWISFHNGWD